MKEISTLKAAKPSGPYSQGIISGGHVYCSGQLPIDVDGNITGNMIEEQTKQVIENLIAVLDEVNSSLDKVVKITVYLADLDDFQKFNEVYSRYFKFAPKPARSTVEVSRLPKNSRIEIDCIAEL